MLRRITSNLSKAAAERYAQIQKQYLNLEQRITKTYRQLFGNNAGVFKYDKGEEVMLSFMVNGKIASLQQIH